MRKNNFKPNQLVASNPQVKRNSTVKGTIVSVLKSKPCSMLMIEKATGFRRDSNICRRIRELEDAYLVIFLRKDFCEISKRHVKFYTADKTLFPTSKLDKK